jgi:hypothetical protein
VHRPVDVRRNVPPASAAGALGLGEEERGVVRLVPRRPEPDGRQRLSLLRRRIGEVAVVASRDRLRELPELDRVRPPALTRAASQATRDSPARRPEGQVDLHLHPGCCRALDGGVELPERAVLVLRRLRRIESRGLPPRTRVRSECRPACRQADAVSAQRREPPRGAHHHAGRLVEEQSVVLDGHLHGMRSPDPAHALGDEQRKRARQRSHVPLPCERPGGPLLTARPERIARRTPGRALTPRPAGCSPRAGRR